MGSLIDVAPRYVNSAVGPAKLGILRLWLWLVTALIYTGTTLYVGKYAEHVPASDASSKVLPDKQMIDSTKVQERSTMTEEASARFGRDFSA